MGDLQFRCHSLSLVDFQNSNGAFKLLVGDTKVGNFVLDAAATKLVVITMSYEYPDRKTNDGKIPSFTITSPKGKVYTAVMPEYNADDMLKTAMYAIMNPEV